MTQLERVTGVYLVAILAALASLALAARAVAATPVPPEVQATIDRVQSKPLYADSSWGLRVIDQATGEVLIDQKPNQLFVPGSIMKTFTTAAVLDAYGTDHRFRTPVYRTSKLRGGRLRGDLVLVASGDYSFGLRERRGGVLGYNSTPAIDHNYGDTPLAGTTILARSHPLAGLEDLAEQVRQSGVRRVAGDVIIDDRLFEAWESPDGLISPIWVNENVIDMETRPSAPGKRAKLQWRPKTGGIRVINRARTGPAGSALTLNATGPEDGVVKLRGRIPDDSRRILLIAQVPDPPAFARTAFIDALEKAGVEVSAPERGTNPRRALPPSRSLRPADRVALRVSPATLSEYIKVILKVSYNRGADDMLCLVALKLGSDDCLAGLEAIERLYGTLGVDPTGVFQFDGAGSSDENRISPTAATTFLRSLTGQPYFPAFFEGVPVLGVNGTLRAEGLGFPAAGFIHAKTGNRIYAGGSSPFILEGGQTRMGYIEAKSGRKLVYADFVNNILLGDQPAEASQGIGEINFDQSTIESAIQQGY